MLYLVGRVAFCLQLALMCRLHWQPLFSGKFSNPLLLLGVLTFGQVTDGFRGREFIPQGYGN